MDIVLDGSTLTVKTASATETEALGCSLGALLDAGDVLALVGELGTGKTCFTRGLAAAAGVGSEIPVVSPSFTILNEYPGKQPVYHFDFYRIDAPGRELDWEWREYFYGQGIVVIEWAEKIAKILPEDYILIQIELTGDNERLFHLRGQGERCAAVIMACVERLRNRSV